MQKEKWTQKKGMNSRSSLIACIFFSFLTIQLNLFESVHNIKILIKSVLFGIVDMFLRLKDHGEFLSSPFITGLLQLRSLISICQANKPLFSKKRQVGSTDQS